MAETSIQVMVCHSARCTRPRYINLARLAARSIGCDHRAGQGSPMHLVGNREWRLTGGWILGDIARTIGTLQRFFAVGDSIRARLVMLALLSTAPLLLLAAVNAYQDLTAARQDAQLEALRVAQLHADLIDEHIQAVDALLRAVGTAVVNEKLESGASAELLSEVLQQLPPVYTELFISSATGPNSGLVFGGSPSLAKGVMLGRP